MPKQIKRGKAKQRQEGLAARAEKRAREARAPAASAAPVARKYGPLMTRAQNDAQLKYGDTILRAQGNLQNAGTYFDQYKAETLALQTAVPGRYAAAAQAIAPPTVGPAVQTPEGTQAAESRALMDRAAQQNLTTQGTAQADYFAGRSSVGSAQKLQARTQGLAEIGRLSSEKDAYALSRRDELRDQRHTRRLENKAFGVDVAEAQADAQDKVADNRRSARTEKRLRRTARRDAKPTPSEQKTAADLAYFRKHGYYPTTGPPKAKTPAAGDKGLTPLQKRTVIRKRNETRTKVDTVSADMGNYGALTVQILDKDGKPTGKTRKPTRDEVFARLRKEGASQDEIKVALALRHGDSTWDKATRQAARRLGYGVPKKYRPGGAGKYKNTGFGA